MSLRGGVERRRGNLHVCKYEIASQARNDLEIVLLAEILKNL